MRKKQPALAVISFLSFILIGLFLCFFAFFAPGHYPLSTASANIQKIAMDVLFACLLLANEICVILSFAGAVGECIRMLRSKHCSAGQFGSILLGIWPSIVIAFLCSWKLDLFVKYLISPIQILLGYLFG